MENKLYKITKLGSVENPYHKDSTFRESAPFHVGVFMKEPKIGERFKLSPVSFKHGFRGIDTSPVTKIIDDCTFETLNSIYKYEPYD
jgi:hypothetical protein